MVGPTRLGDIDIDATTVLPAITSRYLLVIVVPPYADTSGRFAAPVTIFARMAVPLSAVQWYAAAQAAQSTGRHLRSLSLTPSAHRQPRWYGPQMRNIAFHWGTDLPW